jgi:hypothetical protein
MARRAVPLSLYRYKKFFFKWLLFNFWIVAYTQIPFFDKNAFLTFLRRKKYKYINIFRKLIKNFDGIFI